jgi:hypothetical protein
MAAARIYLNMSAGLLFSRPEIEATSRRHNRSPNMIFVIEPAQLCRHEYQSMPIIACLRAESIAPGQ